MRVFHSLKFRNVFDTMNWAQCQLALGISTHWARGNAVCFGARLLLMSPASAGAHISATVAVGEKCRDGARGALGIALSVEAFGTVDPVP